MPITATYQPPRINAIPVIAAAARAAEHAMAEVMIDKSRPNVPRDTTRLAESGRVVDSAATGSYATYGADDAEISVGGWADDGGGDTATPHILAATNDYAIIQHENMDLEHPNGGGPKWLENVKHAEQAAVLGAAKVIMAKVL